MRHTVLLLFLVCTSLPISAISYARSGIFSKPSIAFSSAPRIFKNNPAKWCQQRLPQVSQSQFFATLESTLEIASDATGGKVQKSVVEGGTGKSIEAGDILAVEYEARIADSDAPPFAKGEQEQFIFKDGSKVRGWDAAVGSMKVGEHAIFRVGASFGYGEKGVANVIPPNAELEFDIKILAWLGNQLRPESLFQKDLDIDPFVASTPESIQAEYEELQVLKNDKYEGNIIDIYVRRIKNISFGFGGSNFFASQSGEKAPWYLNPNLTFPAMIAIVIVAFATVFSNGGVREKGASRSDLEVAVVSDQQQQQMMLHVDAFISDQVPNKLYT